METISKILESLNIDETFFYQMGIFIVLFFILKMIFFERLQEVVKLREEKTIKRKEAAEQKFIEVEKLSSIYQEKMKKANMKGREIYNHKKRRIIDDEKIRLKKVEEEVNVEFENEVGAFRDKAECQEKELLKNSEALCDKLVKKLTV